MFHDKSKYILHTIMKSFQSEKLDVKEHGNFYFVHVKWLMELT
jgi:hypothetical protein